MDLYEYQGKQYFARFGIPTSPGAVADTVDEAVTAAQDIGYPVVVKAQVKVGGRGKAGGIKLAADADEVRTHAAAILGMDLKGHTVRRVWIERSSDIAHEYYASFTLDRSAKLHLCMVSAKGGVDIEEVADTDPGAIARRHIDPVDGMSLEVASELVTEAGLHDEARTQAAELLVKLYTCYVEGDCDLAEINPLILTTDGRVHALDAKVTLDDNAAFRHPEWEEYAGTDTLDPREQLAKQKGLQYVGLDGFVGIIANGAGLAMSTCDVSSRSAASRRTSSTSAAAPTRRRWPTPWRSSPATTKCGPSSSTSSAVSPEARRWRTGWWRRLAGSTSTCRSSSASTAPTPMRDAASSPSRSRTGWCRCRP